MSNEGTMYQRGPNGEVPNGSSFNGDQNAYGTIGGTDHVTMFGEGWHRSWDNPGTTADHFTNHATGQRSQA